MVLPTAVRAIYHLFFLTYNIYARKEKKDFTSSTSLDNQAFKKVLPLFYNRAA